MRAFQVIAMVAAIAVAVFGLYPTYTQQQPSTPTAAESFASAAAAAFAGTTLASNPDLTAAQRAAGIPTDPVAGWDIPTTDARHVQLVLPGGLGAGEVTPGGQVVYPDRGAGFEVLAENTGPTTGRTITRIPTAPEPLASGAQRLPVVTMFVRTPADTVMFARTDGVLTVNDATTGANAPIAAIAPAAARDARGAFVPSGFVTTKIKPGLYLLAQVIAPGPDTAFPVYADPGFLDGLNDLGNTIVDATVSAATTSVNFVKANPIESIEIAAGGLMMATGVGTGFGVGLIADGTTSLIQKAGEATGNPALQALGTGMEIAGYISPTQVVKKGVADVAEIVVEGLGKKEADAAAQALSHTDDIVAVKPVTPSAAPKLPEPTATKPADLPTTPGAETPKLPNAPPGSGAVQPQRGTAFPPPVKTEIHLDARDDVGNMRCEYCGSRIYAQEGPTLKGDKIPDSRAQVDHYMPRKLGGDGVRENGRDACRHCNSQKGDMDPEEFEAARDDIVRESRQRIRDYERTHGAQPDGVWKTPNDRPGSANLTEQQPSRPAERPSSPSDQRSVQAHQAAEVTDQRRDDARDSAQQSNQSGNTQRSNNDSGSDSGRKSSQQEQKKKQSTRHKQRKGQR